MNITSAHPLTIAALRSAYVAGNLDPVEVVSRLFKRLDSEPGTEAWILLRTRAEVLTDARAAAARIAAGEDLPLLGVPFAVKDNIDVAGLPTTAGCPAFAQVAEQSAAVVERLVAAGAILIGKTNLDQFATGLVGTRSPYGAVTNPHQPEYMSGGSSAGSAAVVARGWVAFSLGTDTAGSGRVPAGACNLVGVKPSTGLVSTFGVLPACRSLDCVSVFAHTVEDGWSVLQVLAGLDARDPYSRSPEPLGPVVHEVRIGVPSVPEFFGDAVAEQAWREALEIVATQPGVQIDTFDLAPFHEVARLLYDGPWVAERRAAVGQFFDTHPSEMDATVHAIIGRAAGMTAVDAFVAQYALEALRPRCMAELERFDLLMAPTAPTIYRHDEIAAEPVLLNSRLGIYTNFVNLLGMAAIAVPGPFRTDGLPAGVTLLGAAGSDHRLAEVARRVEPALHRRLGTTDIMPTAAAAALAPLPEVAPAIEVAVVGAHLSGLPLNWQLVERGALLRRTTTTVPDYRLFELPGTVPPKPGLLRVANGGAAIEVEVWAMPLRHYGSFVASIPAPLGIGTLSLADGSNVQGFVCEASACAEAIDITAHGGWRAWLRSRSIEELSRAAGAA